MEAPSSSDISLFGGFRLDRRSGVLFRRDERGVFAPLAMGSRALDILGVLVDRPGEIVSRSEIMGAVWPETVVEDSNLNVQIAALRRVLDEGRTDGSCIQTIPGRGYRFTAAVTQVEPSAPPTFGGPSGNGAAGPILAVSPVPTAVATRHRRWLGVIALFVVLATAGSAGAWIWDHRWLGSTDTRPPLSMVVLPFTNLGTDPDQQHFADAITADLTTDLSRVRDIHLISRNSDFSDRIRLVDTKQVGRELGVRYVLEGSVQRSGNQVRVNAQLVDAETDSNLWAERFDGDMGNLFALQDDITSRMAIALNLELINRAAGRLTEDSGAMDYILRGRAAMNTPPSRDAFAKQASLFERALSLDPGSLEAKSRLATVLVVRAIEGMTDSPAADIARAEDLIEQALAASPLNPQAHYAKGLVMRTQGKPEDATFEFEAVLAHNRNSIGALFQLGWCKLMTGSIDEVIPASQQLIHLSPHDPGIANHYLRMGWVHLIQSHIDEAILWLERARSANPRLRDVRSFLASAYALKGETEHGAAELGEERRLKDVKDDGRFSSIARLARGYWGGPTTRALVEATVFAGLRKAGMPEE
jgi:adenylate cyclase